MTSIFELLSHSLEISRRTAQSILIVAYTAAIGQTWVESSPSGLSPPPPPPSSSFVPTIEWTRCPSLYPARLECGRLRVPMDHDEPGDSDNLITLGVVRSRARSAGQHLGNLIVNPGGPGVSEVSKFVTEREEELISQKLMEVYDIIALDPRGVGVSNPVKCDASIYNERVPSYVRSQSDVDYLVSWSQALGRSCANLTGPLINYLDTVSVAKDLDLLRQASALGDDKLNYLGFSYGTQLGSQYAELFPEHVGRMVLDGITDHSQSEVGSFITGAMSFEDTFNSVARWCNTTSECALYHQDVPAIFDRLVDDANEQPILAPSCHSPYSKATGDHAVGVETSTCRSEVTGYEIIDNSQAFLQRKSLWIAWSKALLEAIHGNATLLSTPLLTSNVFPITNDLNEFSDRAIVCQDWLRPTGPRAGRDLLSMFKAARALAPHTRGISQVSNIPTGCIGWPAPVRNPQRRLCRDQLEKAPPIMLVSSLHDPSTSIVWAIRLRKQMPTAVSIFRDGFGHTSYREYGETQMIIDEFLIQGSMAEDLTTLDSCISLLAAFIKQVLACLRHIIRSELPKSAEYPANDVQAEFL
ncbi:proteinase [Arthroderma uncinatum]|uniref:proteinase n=1 Tax=Arthroderma uncinatum TaxID=74035 RepID=UPI00144ABCC4|nr:proteinase [Arthroderma uncinatum]KAF3484090.1 proteinase [Arthroderma uncinatum]